MAYRNCSNIILGLGTRAFTADLDSLASDFDPDSSSLDSNTYVVELDLIG